jgi:hypothetical protein
MSELTRCNYCTLQSIKARHGEDQVFIRYNGHGWLEVRIHGKDEPLAWFLILTAHCVC